MPPTLAWSSCPPQGHLYTVPVREQGNIYKPNNKTMAEEMNEKQMYDVHTKEIDLVNRDPKHLNDDVVKVRGRLPARNRCPHSAPKGRSVTSPWSSSKPCRFPYFCSTPEQRLYGIDVWTRLKLIRYIIPLDCRY